MTDLKDLFDQAAGPAPVVTEAEVSADLDRARRAARRRRFTGVGLTAGAAAVTIAALAVPLVLSPGSGPAVSAPPGAVTTSTGPVKALSASEVLLAAAAQEDKAEAATGKYFRVRTVSSREWTVMRGKIVCCASTPAGPGGYKLRELTVTETWTGLKGGTGWVGFRSLGAHPATAADEAAWRRAGSPASWNTGPTDTADKHERILLSKPDKASFFEQKDGADRYTTLGTNGTLAAVQSLPATPEELRKRLLAVKPELAPAASDVAALARISAGLLSDTPAPPKVRAAAFRLLAGLPGAVVKQNVTDLAGRTGTAVEFAFPAYRLNLQLIVDPTTGKLLSSRHTGGKNGDSAVLLSGWTNDTPQAPPATIK
jgi:hypothetical protein